MTGSDLFREIGNISEEYIIEAENYSKNVIGGVKELWRAKVAENAYVRRTLVTAACLMVCFGLVTVVQQSWRGADSATEGNMNKDFASNNMSGLAAEDAMEMESNTTSDSEASVAAVKEENTTSDTTATALVMPEEGMSQETAGEAQDGMKQDSNPETGNGSVAAQTENSELDKVCGYPLQAEEMQKTEWDLEAVKERQADYPNDIQELQKLENVYVVLHGKAEVGQELWEDFLKQVNSGNAAQIDIVRFTVEGDAIIETVYFDGEIFRLCVDKSRDAFSSKDTLYYEGEYKYLQKTENVSEDNTRTVEYMLTDCEEDLSEVLTSGDEKKRAELEYYSIVFITE